MDERIQFTRSSQTTEVSEVRQVDYVEEYERWHGPKADVPEELRQFELALHVVQDKEQAFEFEAEPQDFMADWWPRWLRLVLSFGFLGLVESQRLKQEIWARTKFCGRPFHWRGSGARAARYVLPPIVYLLVMIGILAAVQVSMSGWLRYITLPEALLLDVGEWITVVWGLLLIPGWAVYRMSVHRYKRLALEWGGVPFWLTGSRSELLGHISLAVVAAVLFSIFSFFFLITVSFFLLFFFLGEVAPLAAFPLTFAIMGGVILAMYYRATEQFYWSNTRFGRESMYIPYWISFKEYWDVFRMPMFLLGLWGWGPMFWAWTHDVSHLLLAALFMLPGVAVASSLMEARLHNLRALSIRFQGCSAIANLDWREVLVNRWVKGAAAVFSLGYSYPIYLASVHKMYCESTWYCGRINVGAFEDELRRSAQHVAEPVS